MTHIRIFTVPFWLCTTAHNKIPVGWLAPTTFWPWGRSPHGVCAYDLDHKYWPAVSRSNVPCWINLMSAKICWNLPKTFPEICYAGFVETPLLFPHAANSFYPNLPSGNMFVYNIIRTIEKILKIRCRFPACILNAFIFYLITVIPAIKICII